MGIGQRIGRALGRLIKPQQPTWALARVWLPIWFLTTAMISGASGMRLAGSGGGFSCGTFYRTSEGFSVDHPGVLVEHWKVTGTNVCEKGRVFDRTTVTIQIAKVDFTDQSLAEPTREELDAIRKQAAAYLSSYDNFTSEGAWFDRELIRLALLGGGTSSRINFLSMTISAVELISPLMIGLCILVGTGRIVMRNHYKSRLRRYRSRKCPRCDYDMSGINVDRCPECGAIIREHVRTAFYSLKRPDPSGAR